MYGTGYGSISGMIHLVARRPVFAAVVVLAAVTVARVPMTPPPPPRPVPQAVVTFTADPTPATADSERETSVPEAAQARNYSCAFAKNTAPSNLCKADLDSIAEYLFHNPTATVELAGSMDHVLAVRTYFVSGESKFGIASGRVHIHVDTDSDNTVAITQVP